MTFSYLAFSSRHPSITVSPESEDMLETRKCAVLRLRHHAVLYVSRIVCTVLYVTVLDAAVLCYEFLYATLLYMYTSSKPCLAGWACW